MVTLAPLTYKRSSALTLTSHSSRLTLWRGLWRIPAIVKDSVRVMTRGEQVRQDAEALRAAWGYEAIADRYEALLAELLRAEQAREDCVTEGIRTLERAQRAEQDCQICAHEWKRHDPEDGRCDVHTSTTGRFDVCECGRDLGWMQDRIAALSTSRSGPRESVL